MKEDHSFAIAFWDTVAIVLVVLASLFGLIAGTLSFTRSFREHRRSQISISPQSYALLLRVAGVVLFLFGLLAGSYLPILIKNFGG